jgi:actin-related protein
MVFNSIEKADITVRNELVNKILLGGGTSLFPNIEKRIHKEIQVLAPPGAPVNVIVTPTRKHSVWLGGAALAANPAFQPMWITRRQYEEVGPSCLHNKLYQ